jgi:hypothetical protein
MFEITLMKSTKIKLILLDEMVTINPKERIHGTIWIAAWFPKLSM